MCGIAGIYGFQDDKLMKSFSEGLAHRGPDGEGLYKSPTASLLSRRLAIIDRKGGDQPIYNENKTVAVVYNGEIYNYRELRKELEAKGHTFRTHSDTEVLVHGYEEWGTSYFDRCNGMFALALHDKNTDTLVIARDHFGIKPLYYAVIRQGKNLRIIFASEIKPLLDSGLVPVKPNDRILYRYLMYRVHDDLEETFFEGIYQLLPGRVMTISGGDMDITSYTSLEQDLAELAAKPAGTYDNSQFKSLFIHSVKLRLISEVPVGTCLSGGLDSSSIVAVIQDLLKKKTEEAESVGKVQNTFSAVFPGSTNDEERYIDDLIRKVPNVKSFKIYPKPEEFFTEIYDFIRTQEEPTISTGPYAQYKVMQEVGKHVTVIIDGQGADEMMAGYIPYYFVYLKQLLTRRQFGRFLKEFITSYDLIGQYLWAKLNTLLGLRRQERMGPMLKTSFTKAYDSETLHVTSDNLKLRLIDDIFRNSLQSLLRYEDRNSMRFSVEGRVPFLDFRLLKHLFSLPDEAIIRNGWNKKALRDAMKSFLPDSIVKRRNKIGFTNPEYEWFMRMKNKIYAIFLSESFASRPYFNQQEVLRAFRGFIEGKTEDTLVFWRMLNVEIWLRIFFDKEIPETTKVKSMDDYGPNEGKQRDISVKGKSFMRFPIRTDLFKKDDNYANMIAGYVRTFFKKNTGKTIHGKKWMVVVSEKIVAISQGRSYFIWEIRPGWMARILSKFVTKTPHGIGLGSPWTMQLAIDEVGLPRILAATAASAVTKPFGMRGVFYRVAGREAAGIDGPTEYSLYPSNVSAKLLPKAPKEAAQEIRARIERELSADERKLFKGAAIIDANDIGRAVIGNATEESDSQLEKLFADNPMGQASEQTPVTIVIER